MDWHLIQKRLTELKMSKETFAGKIGCSLGTIQNLKRGRRVNMRTLILAAQILGVSVDELIKEDLLIDVPRTG